MTKKKPAKKKATKKKVTKKVAIKKTFTKKRASKKKVSKKKTSKKKVSKKKVARKKAKKPIEGELLPNPVGRPTDYREEFNELAYNYCLLGADDKELAEYFKVSDRTINTWKIKHPKFLQSIYDGKETADAKVARSMFERALGYSHPEEKVFCSEGEITTHETTKHYPPDTKAASLWLRNRQKKKWRDETVRIEERPLQEMTLEELETLKLRLERERKALVGEHD